MLTYELNKVEEFYNQKDDKGRTNYDKIKEFHKVIARTDETSRDKSFEEISSNIENEEEIYGAVVEDGRVIGFGIHILNEDIYPLKSFKIYLRNCQLTGSLDLTDFDKLRFLDIYNNSVDEIKVKNLDSMVIFGAQNNCLTSIATIEMPNCKGIDVGKNQIKEIDISNNQQLVELYVNDNMISSIDLSKNTNLKYFYCQGNNISKIDTRANKLLRHLNTGDNPMVEILSLAPQREEELPLELRADDGGYVGLKFNPIYNAQWKETGLWEQCYMAYPKESYTFSHWEDENGNVVSKEVVYADEYGSSKKLKAKFIKR